MDRWSPTGLVLHLIFQEKLLFHLTTLSTRCVIVNFILIKDWNVLIQVSVAIIDFKPEFEYTMVPRMSLHTYLQAVVTNTSSYSILSGPANVFLDNNFIAKVRKYYTTGR